MKATAPRRAGAFDIHPLTGGLGAELLGIDLSVEQPAAVYDEIFQALSDHGVIFFRDQGKLSQDGLLAFARHFGKTSGTPMVKTMDGYPDMTEVRKEPEQEDAAGNLWHTDQSARAHPVRATVLLAREMPAYGGDTAFINMARAYEALSDGLKKTLEGLRAYHSEKSILRRLAAGSDLMRSHVKVQMPEATHPVVIRLPENGRKSLYVNPGKTGRFDGWTDAESEGLLDYLYQHAQKPEFGCRFRWQVGSMAMWDNYQTWHYAVNDYHGQRRVMHRTTVEAAPFS